MREKGGFGVGDGLKDRFVDVDGFGDGEELGLGGDGDVEDGDCDGDGFGDGFGILSAEDMGGKMGSRRGEGE